MDRAAQRLEVAAALLAAIEGVVWAPGDGLEEIVAHLRRFVDAENAATNGHEDVVLESDVFFEVLMIAGAIGKSVVPDHPARSGHTADRATELARIQRLLPGWVRRLRAAEAELRRQFPELDPGTA